MKKFIKIMLAAFFISLSVVPLSISAESSSRSVDSGGLVYGPVLDCDGWNNLYNILIIPYSLRNKSTIGVYYTGPSYTAIYVFDSATFSYGHVITGSGYYYLAGSTEVSSFSDTLFNLGDANASVMWSDFDLFPNDTNTRITFDDLNNYYKSSGCPIPEPITNVCSVYNLNVLSDPLITSLLNSLSGKVNVSNWYIAAISESSGDIDDGIECNTNQKLGFRSGYRLTISYNNGSVSNSYAWKYIQEGVLCSTYGSGCRCYTATNWTTDSLTVVLTKGCYDSVINSESGPVEVNDSLGNQLLENGNSSTQSASSSIDSVTNSFNSTASHFESFESQFNSNLTSSLQDINVSDINLGSISDFTKTASFVKTQFDDILSSSGIYQTAISFVLIIGVALLLLGRRL